MKILMISSHFNLPGDTIPIGGVQRHISYITKELVLRGYEVEWCYKPNFKNIRKIPDIIIAHDFVSFIPDINIPQITVFHGYEGNIPPLPQIIEVRKDIEKKSFSSICVGEYLKKWYGHNPNKIIWGGVEETNYVEKPNKRKILYLGRLDPDQAPLIVFEALGKTKERYIINICGTGRLEKEIKQICDTYKLEATFNGFVSNPDFFIKNSDVIICSGYLTILESYINKRIVISPYGNELKKDYLELMPSPPILGSTAEEIAYKLDENYISESQDILRNYTFAKNNTWNKVVDCYENLFENIINKGVNL